MAVKVYFSRLSTDDDFDKAQKKILELFKSAKLDECYKSGEVVGLKIHFGEEGNRGHIKPQYVRPIVREIKSKGAKPFLTDTNTLYAGRRSNSVDHLHLAYEHGFTMENVEAPVIISDGLLGDAETEVNISGIHFKKVSLATDAIKANTLIVLTHITGHLATGLGGAIKNVGMGLASRKGKMRQHSNMKPEVSDDKCTGCQECIQWCPTKAISMKGEFAFINRKICIGCGECLTVCRFNAIKYNFRVESKILQEKMAEHSLGVAKAKGDKIGYINFLWFVSKDCDCMATKDTDPVMKDIGVLASKDIIAIDKACYDLIKKETGKTIESYTYPHIDAQIQLRHGEKIGLGTMNYELIEI